MDLYGTHADAQLIRDQFVGHALHHPLHHLLLSVCQIGQSLSLLLNQFRLIQMTLRMQQSLLNAVYQCVIRKVAQDGVMT